MTLPPTGVIPSGTHVLEAADTDPMPDFLLLQDEWKQWAADLPKSPNASSGEQRLLYPDPHEDGGLPPGWRIWSRYADFDPDYDITLAQRPNGYWVTVYCQRSADFAYVVDERPTLTDLYNTYLDIMEESTLTDSHAEMAAPWIRRVLLRLYDPTIAEEAAERLVLALGGRAGLPPRITLLPR